MQTNLVNKRITREKILTLAEYEKLTPVSEFLLYSDNILEGIVLLNDLTEDSFYLSFYGVVYEPIDQPVYVFTCGERFYAIKICGSYSKWELPDGVCKIIDYVDLPDYIFYSLKNQKVILAGESTETASVGNSQWQREGRKLGAAVNGAPFIYQTFYSGRDESQDKIREPNSLQAYNCLVYSVRYKTPSFVAYFENGFQKSQTRSRPPEGRELLCKYIKATLIADTDPSKTEQKKQIEKQFFLHIISYLQEPKYKDLHKNNPAPRLKTDLPCVNVNLYNELMFNAQDFANKLVDYIYSENAAECEKYLRSCELLHFNESKFTQWKCYDKKKNICDIIGYLKSKSAPPVSYVSKQAKVGFADTALIKEFLLNKFPHCANRIRDILNECDYPLSVLMPLRIHKISNGDLTFSPDPESGEIVAFSELFSFDISRRKKRPVIGYCTVDTPSGFELNKKDGTKLYKALAHYADIIVINNGELITDLPVTKMTSDYTPICIANTKPVAVTEETAVVSAFLNQTTINSDWELCFIHTHHSSWQQITVRGNGFVNSQKVNRVSTKVDLILQQNSLFMIGEGKNNFLDIIKDGKIRKAMTLASQKIDELFNASNRQFDAFIYNLHTTRTKDPEFYVLREAETVALAMDKQHFCDIAFHKDYVVIIVYTDSRGKTGFKLVYSPDFDGELAAMLNKEFGQ